MTQGAKRVTAAVIRRKGEIFIARRLSGGSSGGMWEFPGGKVEAGETPEEALGRELFEEFEVEARVGRPICTVLHTYPEGRILLMVFEADLARGEPRLNSHQEARWVSPEDLEDFDFAEADRAVVRMLLKEAGR